MRHNVTHHRDTPLSHPTPRSAVNIVTGLYSNRPTPLTESRHDLLPGSCTRDGRSIRCRPLSHIECTKSNLYPGIGREIALSFARQRCPQIAVLDIDEAGLEDTARECLSINPEVTLLRERYDSRKEEEVKGAVDSVHRRFGRIDYAVNCAGSSSSPLFLKSETRVDWVAS